MAVDAARGGAMLLVCASHVDQYFAATSPALEWLFITVTRIATPTFLLLSGFVIGYLLRTTHGKVSLALIDRALFLLLVAHWGLGLAQIDEHGWREWLLARVTIVDAVGVALFVAVLVRRWPAAALAALGAALYAVSWFSVLTWAPQSAGGQWAAALLFEIGADGRLIDVALVPYVGVFLFGMALSGHLHTALLARDFAAIGNKLLWLAGALIAVALLGIVAWKTGERLAPSEFWTAEASDGLRETLDPRVKRPPSPAYLLFYGGAGLLLLALFFKRWPLRLVTSVTQPLRLIGQASLAVFIAQDWLFFLVPEVLGFATVESTAFWLAYLALGIYVLYRLARDWRRRNGNRYLTIGLKRIGRRKRGPPQLTIAGAEPPAPRWHSRADGWLVPVASVDPSPARHITRGTGT